MPNHDTGGWIDPRALVEAGAHLAAGVHIGPFAVIEADTTIGPDTQVRAHAVIKRFTTLGAQNTVHEGAILGGEPQDVSFAGGASRLQIGDRNRIREGVTIHRATATGGVTVVGSDCFLMAYAHIAHECQVGNRVIMANNSALAGHVHVGDQTFIAGGTMVHQFCHVGRLAMLGGKSKVVQDCLPFVITDGVPARPRGLNVVGLRRAGVTASQLRTLREAYRLLTRGSLHREVALERMAALLDPLVDEMIAFVRASKRGIGRARGVAAED